MTTLRWRIGLALLVFASITLLAVGSAMWVVLRDLHRDAALASLAELTLPYTAQARQRIPLTALRPLGDTEDRTDELAEAFRESSVGRRATQEFLSFVEQTQAEIDAAGISVVVVQDDEIFVRDPVTGAVGRADLDLAIPRVGSRGLVQTGATAVEGRGDMLYAATLIREPRTDRAVPTLVLLRADDSARLATADLARSLLVAGLILLLVGIPLAWGLSRSVTGPLRRLALATGTVARGKLPEPLPTSGPAEVAEASAAFNAMAAEVGASREEQRRLLADIRHDLRTPLTVISGFAEALRDGTATGDVAERAAGAISDEAARLERMLADLDQLAVPGVAGPTPRLETIDSLEIARQAVERFAAEAQASRQRLDVDPGAVRATLTADRSMLERILGNIIANALAHAPSPGGHVLIEVAQVGPAVSVAVRDDGPGIPRAALPHVFDRFYRADPARTAGGSGLGLAIVRDLAEAMGGEAFAENVAGGGARVGIRLPSGSVVPTAQLA